MTIKEIWKAFDKKNVIYKDYKYDFDGEEVCIDLKASISEYIEFLQEQDKTDQSFSDFVDFVINHPYRDIIGSLITEMQEDDDFIDFIAEINEDDAYCQTKQYQETKYENELFDKAKGN